MSSISNEGYKLSYLPLRARAEATRLILAYGAVDYEDVVIPLSEWGNLKYDRSISHFDQLPSLLLPSGKLISQSGTIVRYLAKVVGIYPSDIELAAEADMVYELCMDMTDINLVLNWFEKDSNTFIDRRASYFAAFPGRMRAALDILKDKNFFGGDSPHFGDFGLFHAVDNSLTVQPSCLDEFPAIKSWYNRVHQLPFVSKYLQDRPKAGTGSVGKPGSLIHAVQVEV
jgi:glutathione S-transferase P